MLCSKSTPKKVYSSTGEDINDCCRVCGENYKALRRGYHRIFASRNLGQRLSDLLDSNVKEESHLSSYLCQPCFAKLSKYETTVKQLEVFKTTYRETVARQSRTKRCTRESPVLSPSSAGVAERGKKRDRVRVDLTQTSRSARRSLSLENFGVF